MSDDLTQAETAVLQKLREGGGERLFTEYSTDEEWAAVHSLRKRGLVDGRPILTGTARVWLTQEPHAD